MPQTVAGFFYDGSFGPRSFISISRVDPTLSSLPFTMNNVVVSDYCNGLILCWCLGDDGYSYVVCNPAKEEWKVLPPRIHSVGKARLGFDLTSSLHFHVFEYMEENGQCVGVDIYSSKTAAWIYKKSKWGRNACVTIERLDRRSLKIVYLNSFLHIMGYLWGC